MSGTSDKGVKRGRRAFLKGAVATGAATAVAAVLHDGSVVPEAEAATSKAPETKSQGYHETDHVRAYYRTARN